MERFVHIELDDPDINTACFGRAPLQAGTLASNGPLQACVLDKINQFIAELSAPNIDPEERLCITFSSLVQASVTIGEVIWRQKPLNSCFL
jgi:hypothetical protein